MEIDIQENAKGVFACTIRNNRPSFTLFYNVNTSCSEFARQIAWEQFGKEMLERIYNRLEHYGVSRGFVRKFSLPKWWEDSMALDITGYFEFCLYVSKGLDLDPHLLACGVVVSANADSESFEHVHQHFT